jgi:hypothetical protein
MATGVLWPSSVHCYAVPVVGQRVGDDVVDMVENTRAAQKNLCVHVWRVGDKEATRCCPDELVSASA